MSEVNLPIEKDIEDSNNEENQPQIEMVDNSENEEEDQATKPVVPEILSLLPLRDSVIYPMLIAPLSIARESSIRMIDESITTNNRIIGIVTQKDPTTDFPKTEEVYEIGCAVIIRTLVKMPDAVRLIVQGVSRFRILEYIQETPYMKVRIEPISEPSIENENPEEIEALRRSIAALFDQAIRLSPQLPEDLHALSLAIQEPNVMADLIAAHLNISVENKQAVLETIPIRDRLKLLLELLSREVRVLELSSKVQSDVSAELSKTQREFYLREQLKAIHRELGDTDDRAEELDELRQKIEQTAMPEEASKEVKREFDRLNRMNPGSSEYTVARTYVDWMLAVPWMKSSEDNLDLKHVKEVLDQDHYGLEKIKDRIIEFLAVRKIKTEGPIRQPILCFAGPPGVGKTSLGKSIAHSLGRKFVRISLGGMRDEAEIRGHRRTYVGALPGQIIQGLRRVEINNPVFVLDEIDKIGTDFRGDPSSALLEVLDPEQNSTFKDNYLDVPVDLSKVFFISTANRLDTIPPALQDRMEIIELSSYTEEEKAVIAERYLVPKQISEHGLKKSQISFTPEAIKTIIHSYTREAGVRNLEREIASIVRKATRKFAEGRKTKLIVNPNFITQSLGAARYIHDAIDERKLIPGVAVGLAWTPVGGEILFIEATRMSGSKGLIVTGQLGDVMKESITAALSYVRSHATVLDIQPDFYDKAEIHVHVPAGAVPKDGPSAGIAMLTALTSLLTERKVKPKLAMTGEITLKGQVLAVGGIKEKVLAAYRAGVNTLILPEENKNSYLEDIPPEIASQLKVHFVKNADEVLKLALTPRKSTNG